jgi:C4-dicarboxylate-specific signal transduction histidine kinase
MEILVNLIQNARQSVAEAGRPDARIVLKLARPEENTVSIEVVDNGVGIPAENLSRIFNHGFTTKQKGHGFGLHASANAATEMGARLSGHSEGPGRGATFRLEIPVTTNVPVGATS